MVNMTLSLPDEFRQKMDKFAWLNWSEIARDAFVKRMRQLEALEQFREGLENSSLSDEDCINLGRKLKEDMLKNQSKK